jgi:hypothetical protein
MSAQGRFWRDLALAPWWPVSLLTGDKSFADNPLLGSRRLNRLGLHAARVRLSHALAARRRAQLDGRLTAEEQADFDRDGFVVKHKVLPETEFRALRSALLNERLPAREMVQGDTITRRIAIDGPLRRAIPGLAAFIDSPAWQGPCRYVAGYDAPPWAYVQTILSHTREAPPDPQTCLHADTFHPTMKAWFFLTDVAADEGAFCYVPGSHRLTPERLAWERAQSLLGSDLPDRYAARGSLRIAAEHLAGLGLGSPKLMAVPANTMVVADTFGFHARGPSVRPSTRIELWAYDRRNPFWPASTDAPLQWLDRMDERPALYWQWLDAKERLSAGRNPWRDVGLKRAGDPP